jgi:hypothetical protein
MNYVKTKSLRNQLINLVFENKTKNTGAYQCVKKVQNFLVCTFMGLLLFASLASIPKIMSLLNPEKKYSYANSRQY